MAIFAAVVLLSACSAEQKPLFPAILNVGVTSGSPGWGLVDAAGDRGGFDHDLTNWLGSQLGFRPVPVDVVTKNRENDLLGGALSLVVATYSITDKRREKGIDFAGPYMLTQQGVMVRAEDKGAYRTVADLRGRTICVTSGSTSSSQLHGELGFPVTIVEKNTNEECRQALHSRQIDAVSTDQLLLAGIQRTDPAVSVPVEIVFGHQERYGVGVPVADKERCEVIRRKLVEFITSDLWETFFRNNLPGVPLDGHKPDPTRLDPC
ncbi:transporter substrate-binding domain-containing protein [Amycolatopsis sp. NPDC021455]|uniref:transporter substrate-binding domain-containing protein n=1 Tax=Amycolatopsis sp. NPDC021455 TaxID=3154901 RepID=UPI0033FC0499